MQEVISHFRRICKIAKSDY